MSWWNLAIAPVAALLALAYGRRIWFWFAFGLFFGLWSFLIVLLPRKELRVPTLPGWFLVYWGNRVIAKEMRSIRDPSDLL
jgi:hypothetical protein